MQPVNIPDELKGIPPAKESPQLMVDKGAIIRDIFALLCLMSGTACVAVGVGLWVHPGAGLAAAGVVVVLVGVLLGFKTE
jgi:hypothetical protein